jgi:hypothetical protein
MRSSRLLGGLLLSKMQRGITTKDFILIRRNTCEINYYYFSSTSGLRFGAQFKVRHLHAQRLPPLPNEKEEAEKRKARGRTLLTKCLELGLGKVRPTYGEWDFRSECCPFCKPHKNDPTNMFTLSISTAKNSFNCFRCGNGGDLSRLVQALEPD